MDGSLDILSRQWAMTPPAHFVTFVLSPLMVVLVRVLQRKKNQSIYRHISIQKEIYIKELVHVIIEGLLSVQTYRGQASDPGELVV